MGSFQPLLGHYFLLSCYGVSARGLVAGTTCTEGTDALFTILGGSVERSSNRRLSAQSSIRATFDESCIKAAMRLIRGLAEQWAPGSHGFKVRMPPMTHL